MRIRKLRASMDEMEQKDADLLLKSPLDLKLDKSLEKVPFKQLELEELLGDPNFADIYVDINKYKEPEKRLEKARKIML